MNTITDEERQRIIAELTHLQGMGDIELAHCMADDQLRELLITLGFFDVVEAYDEVPKWFA